VVERLPSKLKALSSIPNTTKTNKKTKCFDFFLQKP
jgi:hypothetical protein